MKSYLLAYILIIYLLFLGLNSKAQSFISYKVYSNDTINVVDKDTLKQGIWKEFWANGDLKSEVSYKNNKKQGLEIFWFDEPTV